MRRKVAVQQGCRSAAEIMLRYRFEIRMKSRRIFCTRMSPQYIRESRPGQLLHGKITARITQFAHSGSIYAAMMNYLHLIDLISLQV
ncbi:hypothetical protein [Rhizobium bangladeshense]|uniref:hypothetical protein n=1 Tax=Rhizobium bangladeshense TaxID=1138189 RepID=UPI001C904E37|nr:hypothetical protein [Rhizobium bangladeshense]MBY3597975.1 hypothetical protein [Rhizobium bangladeshense]